MRKLGVLLGLMLLVCAGASVANASPINYVYQGTGAGFMGGTYFENASFTITLVGDTTTVIDYGEGLYINPTASGTVWIQGIGTATFTGRFQMFDNTPYNVSGFSRFPDAADLIDMVDPSFGSYDLRTNFGPVFVAYPYFGQFNCDYECVGTTLGDLEFISMYDVTFTAGNGATPEPGTLVLMGAGVLGLAQRLRRKL